MKTLRNFRSFIASTALFATLPAFAGGPISSFICGSTPPTKYASTVSLNFDKGNSAGSSSGSALGTRTKAQADAIVEAAISLWTSVTTASVPLARGSDMSVDVTSSNYTTYISAFTDGLNPVMYDTDGSIIDAYYGTGSKASVLGVAGSTVVTSGSSCSPYEGVAIINGFISSTDTRLTQVVAHELGHLIGLDHTQLDATQGLTVATYPIMYPTSSSSSTATLKDDDKSAISALYPSPTVYSSYQYIYGNFYLADGTTAIKGANLWVKETTTGKLYSVVSDFLKEGTGYFRLLVPPGTYNLYAEAISSSFTGGSSVGPYASTSTDSSFLSPMYTGTTAMSTLTFGNSSPTAITVTSSCSKQITFKFDGTGTVGSTCYSVPGAPTISSVTPSNTKLTVAFTAPSSTGNLSITSYTVTCGTVSATGTSSPISVSGLVNGTTYSCTVTATNALGTGTASSAASGTPAKAPGTPVMTTVVAGDSQITASFTEPATNGSAITSYTVTCTPTTGMAVSASGLPTFVSGSASITVTGLTNGMSYACNVKATNAAGTGGTSSSLSATPVGVPGAPTIGTVTAGNAQISVAFTAPSSNGGSTITGYNATCTPTSGTAVSATGTTSPITVTGLTNGTAYTCKVKATNSAGTGSESSASSSVTPATVPGAPTIGTVTASNTQISVAFTAPSSNGGSTITSYTATCTPSSGTAVSVSSTSSPIAVTGLTNGTAYTCKVKATNAMGTGSESAASSSATPATVPGAPTIGTVTAGDAQISVAFTAPSSNGGSAITGYTATCTPTSGAAVSATGTASPITVSGLTNGTAYTCKVKATNVMGTGSESSASSSATPTTVPGAPTIGTATAGNAQISVSFTAPSSTGGSAITGYTATCTPTSGTAVSTSGTASPIVVTGLINGTAYTCKVKATNASGTGSESVASNSATPATVPGAPTIGAVTAGNAQISVAFTAPTSNGGSAITGYTAICTPTSGTAVSATGTSSPIVVTGLTNGTAYTCIVKATNAMGTGVDSSASSSVTPATVPSAPTIGTVTAGNAQISVAFAAPASNGGSAITSYTATCTPTSGTALSATGTASPITVTGLTNGTAYTCKVKATNTMGTGSESAASSSATPATVPGAPTIGAVTAGNAQISVAFTAPASNGGIAITGYTATCAPASGTAISVSGTSSPITVTGLTNGTAYTCKVKATNAIGTGSESSASSSATPSTVPGAPTIGTATAGNSQISVAFTAPSSNGGSAITGYTATCTPTSGTAISASGTASPILVTGLTNGVSYGCAVTASNANGAGTSSSSASATPGAVPGAPTVTSATGGNAQIVVAFNAPISNGGSAITGYTATCAPTSGTAVSATSSNTTAPLSITVTGLTRSATYTCKVKATNAFGAGTESDPSTSVQLANVPGGPNIEDIIVGVQSLQVVFNEPSDGGSPITSYRATCGTKSTTGTASPLTVIGLTAGLNVNCSVTATNAVGTGPAGATGGGTPVGTSQPPTLDSVAAGAKRVTVGFKAPTNTGGVSIIKYIATCGAKSAEGSDSPIVVTDLDAGVAVTCTVVAQNEYGDSALSNVSDSVTPFAIPNAPTITSVTRGNQQVTVAFTHTPTANVSIANFRASCGSQSVTGTTSPIIVTNLDNGVPVTCTVVAISTGGGESDPSAPSESVTPATVPGVPILEGVQSIIGGVRVALDLSNGDGGSPITSITASCGSVSVNATSGPISVTGLTAGTTVTCTLRATNAVGSSAESAPSVPITVIDVPGAPTIISATVGDGFVGLNFTAPANNGGYPILDYTATCGSTSATATSSPITISGLTNGVRVNCSVKARSELGSGPSSSSVPAVPYGRPSPPTVTSVTAGNAQVQVAFTAPSNTGGGPILSYTATCGTKSATGSASPLTVTGLTNGVAVTCTVTATSIGDTSDASTPSASVTPVGPPDAPTLTSVTAGNAQAQVSFTVPANNGGSAILDYTATCGSVSVISSAPPITVAPLVNGTQVSCTVKARNAQGTSAASNAVNVTPVAPITCSLDFSGDGTVNATDALLFQRWLFGFRDAALVNGIDPVPANATTQEFADAVKARMVFNAGHDLDGNGEYNAMTDALLLIRLIQGVKGTAFTNGALGTNATRVDFETIRVYVNNSCGTSFAP